MQRIMFCFHRSPLSFASTYCKTKIERKNISEGKQNMKNEMKGGKK
jgi:hypothetical protein